MSFRAFVEGLERAALRGSDVQAAVLEEGTEGVRIMTVHRSKGLEFPVVVLCDPDQNRTFTRPSQLVDPEAGCWYQSLAGCTPIELQEGAAEVLARDGEETDRLLYVAVTRARDILVIPALADRPLKGWTELLKPAIYPYYEDRLGAARAPGCPDLGLDTVPHRPQKAPETDSGVRPGLHRSQSGGEIVWWGPGGLPISDQRPHGLRHQELLVRSEDSAAGTRSSADHAGWQRSRAESHERAHAGALRVRTATELARGRTEDSLPELPTVAETSAAGQPGRPSGIRFGSLVHGVLEQIPYAPGVDVAPYVRQQARLLGANEAERSAAIEAVRSALAHPLLLRAAASPDCRREAPFVHCPREGDFNEGTIDLVFREDREGLCHWVVVEFKTSKGGDETTRRYGIQLQTYVDAVGAATGDPVEGCLLVV
jgi:ATP-dependent exoDNAse (exonuclease V) beta subunit